MARSHFKKMLGIGKVATGAGVVLALAGCVAPLPKQANMVHEGQTIVVVSNKATTPNFYRVGSQGLLDMAINHVVTHTVEGHVKAMEVPDSTALREQVAKVLVGKGYKVTVEPNPLDITTLPKFDGSQAHRTRGDWTQFGADHHADYVLLLSLSAYGAARSYYGFIPTSKPYPVSNFLGEMIDAKTNTEVWRDGVYLPGDGVEGWDTPPDYEVLSQRIREKYDDNAKSMVATIGNDFPGLVTDATAGLSGKPTAVAAPAAPASGAATQQASK